MKTIAERKGNNMNNKLRAVLAAAMLLCSVALIAFGLFGDFEKFGYKQIIATLLPTQAYRSSANNTVKSAGKEINGTAAPVLNYSADDEKINYIVNTDSKVFHHPWCSFAEKISEENIKLIHNNAYELIEAGYKPCGKCHQ